MPGSSLLAVPLLSALTIVVLGGFSEWGARHAFSSSGSSTLGCMIVNDPVTGTRARPDCVCYQKIRESPNVEYRFNNRGHRAGFDLHAKSPGTYRIVLVGSSMAEGLRVPWPQTFAALLPERLTKKSGIKIEVYDEGLEYGTPRHIDMNLRQVLEAQPDLILWTLTKWDLENVDDIEPPPPSFGAKVNRMAALFSEESFANAVRDNWTHVTASLQSRSAGLFFVNYCLSLNSTEFVKRYLKGGGTDFLKSEPPPFWISQVKHFAQYTGRIAAGAKRAGVPLVVSIIPARAEAIMISQNAWPRGYDPYRFGEEIQSAVLDQGGVYVDTLSGFRSTVDAGRDYYPVDGHPNAAGHALLSRLLADRLCALVSRHS